MADGGSDGGDRRAVSSFAVRPPSCMIVWRSVPRRTSHRARSRPSCCDRNSLVRTTTEKTSSTVKTKTAKCKERKAVLDSPNQLHLFGLAPAPRPSYSPIQSAVWLGLSRSDLVEVACLPLSEHPLERQRVCNPEVAKHRITCESPRYASKLRTSMMAGLVSRATKEYIWCGVSTVER